MPAGLCVAYHFIILVMHMRASLLRVQHGIVLLIFFLFFVLLLSSRRGYYRGFEGGAQRQARLLLSSDALINGYCARYSRFSFCNVLWQIELTVITPHSNGINKQKHQILNSTEIWNLYCCKSWHVFFSFFFNLSDNKSDIIRWNIFFVFSFFEFRKKGLHKYFCGKSNKGCWGGMKM